MCHGYAEFLFKHDQTGGNHLQFDKIIHSNLAKAAQQMKRAITSNPYSVQINWEDLGSTSFKQIPKELPHVFPGDTITCFALSDQIPEDAKVNLITPFERLNLPMNLKSIQSKLIWKYFVKLLSMESLEGQGTEMDQRDEIEALALEYQLNSPFTTYFAIERGRKKTDHAPVTPIHFIKKPPQEFAQSIVRKRREDIAITENEIGEMPSFDSLLDLQPKGEASQVVTWGDSVSELTEANELAKATGDDLAKIVDASTVPSTRIKPIVLTQETQIKNPLHLLLRKQFTDGHWELDEDLCSLLDKDWASVQQREPSTCGENTEERTQIWATALVLAYLELVHSEAQPEWHLITEKATRWLQLALEENGGEAVDVCKAEATEYLSEV